MKKLLLLPLLALCIHLQAQITSGAIIYDQVVKMNIQLPPGMEAPKGMPNEIKFPKVLYFNENESLFKNSPKKEEVTTEISDGEGMHINIKQDTPDEQVYKNLAKGKRIERRMILDKPFLITEDTKSYTWKVTGEQKTILNYLCLNATTKVDTTEVSAWFTAQIPVQNGPDSYGQLPGMILELSIDNGERMYVATEIIPNEYPADELVAPSKGKKISEKDFIVLKEEKMAEMQAQHGGKGGVMIIKTIEN